MNTITRQSKRLTALAMTWAFCTGLLACSGSTRESTAESASEKKSPVTVSASQFGQLPSGEKVIAYTLKNDKGMEVVILSYGGIIQSLKTPDRNGKLADVVMGFDFLDEYIADQRFFGPLIGRYANRIGGASYKHNDTRYKLEKNKRGNHLHGGSKGFHKVAWESNSFTKSESAGVVLAYDSPDGEAGFPGTLKTTATYELNRHNELILTLKATTDKATPVSLTNHSYFNLAGGGSIENHLLTLKAKWYTPVNEKLIPTGDIIPVDDTPFDFRTAKAIGKDINTIDDQLNFGLGYDHNWVVSKTGEGLLKPMANLVDLQSGRLMEILSTSPAIQFYSGNYLEESVKGKQGKTYDFRNGLALEPQEFPDAPNQSNFPNTILQPGKTYSNIIVYRFSSVH